MPSFLGLTLVDATMGNDGGSIPKRRELVKSASRLPTISELKATALESLGHAWTHDPISSEPLDMENVVSDWRGRLYNYETILKGLMPSGDTEAEGVDSQNKENTIAAAGITSLRDAVKLKFKPYSAAESTEKTIWACPLSLKELGPATKAVYIVPCGHVFAEAAMKEIQEHCCPECSEPFEEQNVIPLLPTEMSEVEKLKQRMEKLKASGLTHSLKRDRASGKKKRKAEGQETAVVNEPKPRERRKTHDDTSSSGVAGINNAMTASLTAKVLAEQEERNKRRRLAAAR